MYRVNNQQIDQQKDQQKAQQEITREQVEQAAAALRAIKPAQSLTARGAVEQLAPTIKEARARGCTWEQVQQQLQSVGIAASRATIARAMRSAQPAKRSGKRQLADQQ